MYAKLSAFAVSSFISSVRSALGILIWCLEPAAFFSLVDILLSPAVYGDHHDWVPSWAVFCAAFITILPIALTRPPAVAVCSVLGFHRGGVVRRINDFGGLIVWFLDRGTPRAGARGSMRPSIWLWPSALILIPSS
jgi:hypothetical protein